MSYDTMKRHGGISHACYQGKDADLKRLHILHDSNEVTFWKGQDHGDSGCLVFREKEGGTNKGAQRTFRTVKLPCADMCQNPQNVQHQEWTNPNANRGL